MRKSNIIKILSLFITLGVGSLCGCASIAGSNYQTGSVTVPSQKKAITFSSLLKPNPTLQKLMEQQKKAKAQLKLGNSYYYGTKVKQSYSKALYLLYEIG